MKFCASCYLGSCRQERKSLFVSNEELANSEFIRDGRAACLRENIMPEAWIEHVNDLYRDFPGRIFDTEGHEIILNMEVFEVPFIREWFRDFACTPCPANVVPRVRARHAPVFGFCSPL